jgi:hypothetical protein
VWLVLASADDRAALWASAGLRARGVAPLEFISVDELAWSRRWVHHIGTAGARVHAELADGRVFASDRVHGVLNRLTVAPMSQLVFARPSDRDYALHEISAFFLSWLHGLDATMLNPPTPQGLGGRWRAPSEWLVLAARAGLATADFVRVSDPADGLVDEIPPTGQDGAQRVPVVVLREQVFGADVPESVTVGCANLAQLSATPLLGVEFAFDGDWRFLTATPFPDLTLGGEALLDALPEALGR